MGFAVFFCQERLITTESATEPVAAVVEVAEGSSIPVGAAFVGPLTVYSGRAGMTFLGVADLGGRPAFFFTGVAEEDVSCVAAAFFATDFAGTAFFGIAFFCAFFFCAGFFLAAALVVDAFLLGVFLLLIFGIIATS